MALAPSFDDTIDYLLEDANGGHVYSNDKAMYGYIEQSKYLLLPYSADSSDPPDIDLTIAGSRTGISDVLGPAGETFRKNNPYIPAHSLTRVEMIKTVVINFQALIDAGISAGPAWLAATLRARWISLGCLYYAKDDRETPYNEVVVIDAKHPKYGEIVSKKTIAELNLLPHFQQIMTLSDPVRNHEFYGTRFAVENAETIWCISELVFRIRGHHYKDVYEELIARTFRATTAGSVELPDNFEYAPIFHTAIHPFGVKALPVMAWKFMAFGKTGDSLVIRHSGAPNGTAGITTASAGLHILATESWFPQFEATYKAQIEKIHNFANQILENKYRYHISASLYGLKRLTTVNDGTKDITLSEAEQIVASVAPFLQGYVIAMNSISANAGNLNFSFGKEKVLEKRSSANPIAQIKMQKLVEVIVMQMEKANDPTAVMATFMNMPEDVKKGQSKTSTAIVPVTGNP